MSSKSSLISITDLTDIRVDIQKVDSRREIKFFVTAFYEGQEWGVCQIIKEQSMLRFFEYFKQIQDRL